MGEFEYKGVAIEWLGHASFRITDGNKVVYIDPYVLDDNPAKADVVITTHEHFDHCPPDKINEIAKEDTIVVGPRGCGSKLTGIEFHPISEGEEVEIKDLRIKAVPAYNIDKPFHPKGLGIGVVLEINGVKIYHAGDTDFIPEMKNLGEIDIALLPIGGTYTMDVEDAAKAANVIKPKVVVPMHYNYLEGLERNPEDFKKLVDDSIEVKIL
ncbi:MAG: metal-dependent hydrolase [Candidatus Aenigmarchaeota archaeon]|nr:metal-dependent hydrolase [Candidatus Aenigmarchaeota archaeon]